MKLKPDILYIISNINLDKSIRALNKSKTGIVYPVSKITNTSYTNQFGIVYHLLPIEPRHFLPTLTDRYITRFLSLRVSPNAIMDSRSILNSSSILSDSSEVKQIGERPELGFGIARRVFSWIVSFSSSEIRDWNSDSDSIKLGSGLRLKVSGSSLMSSSGSWLASFLSSKIMV